MRGLLLLSVLVLALGCGGGSDAPRTVPEARMNMSLAGAPTSDYKQINLDIQRVEVSQTGSAWTLLAEPRRTFELRALSGGITAPLASNAALPPGRYARLRLILGSNSTVVLGDESVRPLKVPASQQAGILLPVSFEVAGGSTRIATLDFDGAHSIQVQELGPVRDYLLQPVVRAYDAQLTGSISGTLRTSSGAPIPGAFVLAQSLDGNGVPVLHRVAQTGADGAFTLDLLPAGSPCFLATQPVVGATAYAAAAAGPFTVEANAPVSSAALTADVLTSTGNVQGTVSPAAGAGQGDVVFLQKSFVLGGSARTLILRTAVPKLTEDSELFQFTQVELGLQEARGLRTSAQPDGSSTSARSRNAPAVNPLSASPVATMLQF